jgi:hypothetical protein
VTSTLATAARALTRRRTGVRAPQRPPLETTFSGRLVLGACYAVGGPIRKQLVRTPAGGSALTCRGVGVFACLCFTLVCIAWPGRFDVGVVAARRSRCHPRAVPRGPQARTSPSLTGRVDRSAADGGAAERPAIHLVPEPPCAIDVPALLVSLQGAGCGAASLVTGWATRCLRGRSVSAPPRRQDWGRSAR